MMLVASPTDAERTLNAFAWRTLTRSGCPSLSLIAGRSREDFFYAQTRKKCQRAFFCVSMPPAVVPEPGGTGGWPGGRGDEGAGFSALRTVSILQRYKSIPCQPLREREKGQTTFFAKVCCLYFEGSMHGEGPKLSPIGKLNVSNGPCMPSGPSTHQALSFGIHERLACRNSCVNPFSGPTLRSFLWHAVCCVLG